MHADCTPHQVAKTRCIQLLGSADPGAPRSLGVLLALSGVELAISCRDMSEKRDTAVMLIGAGLVLRAGTGPAFVVSLLAAAGLKRS